MRYSRVLNPEAEDSLARIARRVADGAVVLDLGAGPGVLGEYLASAKRCTVDGVEIDPEAATAARPFYRRLVSVDLEQSDLHEVAGDTRYQYVICADILEHLRSPERLLRAVERVLAPEGRLLVSIPNVAHVGLIADLLAGEFRYRPLGLLDRTHLRFFTRKSVEELLEGTGFTATGVERVVVDPRATEFHERSLDALPPTVARYLLLRPESRTYQFVVEAMRTREVPQAGSWDATDGVPELEFAVQLYWHGRDEGFADSRGVLALGRVGAPRQLLRLAIPRDAGVVTALRLDPLDRYGYLRLYALRIVDASGTRAWEWDGSVGELETELRVRQMHLAPCTDDGARVSLVSTGIDPQLELPIPDDLGPRLSGGAVEIELSWPMSTDYRLIDGRIAAQLAEQSERIARQQRELEAAGDLARALRGALDAEWNVTSARLAELVRSLLDSRTWRLALTLTKVFRARGSLAGDELGRAASALSAELPAPELGSAAWAEEVERRIAALQTQVVRAAADSHLRAARVLIGLVSGRGLRLQSEPLMELQAAIVTALRFAPERSEWSRAALVPALPAA